MSAAAAVGRKASELYGTGLPPYLDIYARVAASGTPERFDTEFDPMEKCFSIAAFSPARGYFTTVFEDVTQRKRSDEALKQSELRFRAVFEQAAVGVALLNTETGKYVRINQAYCDFIGYSAEEMLQKSFADVTFAQDVPTNVDFNRQIRAGQRESATFEKRYVHKNGSIVWGSLTISPLWRRGETPPTYLHVAIVEDITERKRIEAELQRSHDELEQRVRERTAELITAHRELETTRRLSDIGTLAATVAHELRNPLAAIRMATYNIKRKAQLPALDSHLATIEKKVTDSDQIIKNLLFYSRIKAPDYQSFAIGPLLDETIEQLANRYAGTMRAITREYPGLAGQAVEADPLLLRELFENVLANAMDAIPGEQGTVAVSGAIDNAGELVITVADNGSGIEPQMLAKVFEPFFSTKSKGTGLGLAVCRQIAQLHGGSIDIASQPGRGTTVTVAIPSSKRQP